MNTTQHNPQKKADVCIIWLHGLGADASDMAGLAQQSSLAKLSCKHIFLDAPVRPVTINNGMQMRAWYDILDVRLNSREDEEGIKASQKQINAAIEEQIKAGFDSSQIILAGFSQGGAMALYVGLTYPQKLGGIMALSAYLPLATKVQIEQDRSTPLFFAFGSFDQVVIPYWTRETSLWFEHNGFTRVSNHEYPMEHTICMQEIDDMTKWLSTIMGDK